MAQVGIRELLEAGVHFGHQTRRWNPKMRRFIHGERGGIYIIDLLKTEALLAQAQDFASEVAHRGGTVLFVGTKKQARDGIKEVAESAGQPFVNHRWLGGLLTNFQTISLRIKRLHDLERYAAEGQLALLPTRERMSAEADLEKLQANLGGVKNMQRVPDAMFVVDLKTEAIAVREAQRLRIPIIGLVDTNCDPDGIDYVVPGNDDAIRSCTLVTRAIGDVVAAGRTRFRAEEERARQEAEEQARREAEERARREAEEQARREAEERAAAEALTHTEAETRDVAEAQVAEAVQTAPAPAPEPAAPAAEAEVPAAEPEAAAPAAEPEAPAAEPEAPAAEPEAPAPAAEPEAPAPAAEPEAPAPAAEPEAPAPAAEPEAPAPAAEPEPSTGRGARGAGRRGRGARGQAEAEGQAPQGQAQARQAGPRGAGRRDVHRRDPRGEQVSDITAAQVKELRDRTGAGMMDCKAALQETGGDIDKAAELLRVRLGDKATKVGAREATEGTVASYIHGDGRVGVLVEVDCNTDFVARNEDFQSFAREVALHIAASPDTRYVSEDEIPQDVKDAELRVFEQQAADKPENVRPKIAEGKLRKWTEEVVLLKQPHVNTDKYEGKTIEEMRVELSGTTGENVVIRRFARFQVGA